MFSRFRQSSLSFRDRRKVPGNMKNCAFLAVLAAAFISTASAGARTQDICAYCQCIPHWSRALVVSCHCRDKSDVLTFSDKDIRPLTHTRSLHVADCGTLELKRDSFKSARNLQDFNITDVSRVSIEVGALTKLDSLTISNANVVLGEKAFSEDQKISRFEFHNVRFDQIPSKAFHTTGDEQAFIMSNVSIGRIAKDAIVMVGGQHSLFLLENSTVETMVPGAIKANISTFWIFNSNLKNAFAGSFDIQAPDIKFIGNDFGSGLEATAMQLKGLDINITYNQFMHMPAGTLSSMQLVQNLNTPTNLNGDVKSRFMFTDNVILSFENDSLDIGGSLHSADEIAIKNNRLTCDCSAGQQDIFTKVMVGQPLVKQYYQDLTLNNFCNTFTCSVVLRDFMNMIEQKRVCFDDQGVPPYSNNLQGDALCDLISRESAMTFQPPRDIIPVSELPESDDNDSVNDDGTDHEEEDIPSADEHSSSDESSSSAASFIPSVIFHGVVATTAIVLYH